MSSVKNDDITADLLLRAYICGMFPMAQSQDDPELIWLAPDARGILPLDSFHVSKSLRKTIKKGEYRATADTAFDDVIHACAAPAADRPSTWINQKIIKLYKELYARGFAHSVEIWKGKSLVGGLYGVHIGAAFFGESMFHTARDCSKLALCHLVGSLTANHFKLLDSQFITDHLMQFGALEIPREDYEDILHIAVSQRAEFQFIASPKQLLEKLGSNPQ